MAYGLPYGPTGWVPNIGLVFEGDFPEEEELEEFHNPKALALERKRIVGLLRGGEFTDEHAQMAWDALIFGVGGVFSYGAFVVIGTTAQLVKLGAKNPWLARPIGKWIVKELGPYVRPLAQRGGLRKAAGKLDDVAKKPAIRNNPVAKSVVQSGATGMKAMSMANRLQILERMDLDVDVDLQELEEFLHKDKGPDMKSRGPASEESDMAYGRQRAWVPYHIWKRRQRRGYRSGGYRSGYGYGGYSSRRRSYRRW